MSTLYEYTFTVIVNDSEEYITYRAYSEAQAYHFLETDGFCRNNVVEITFYAIAQA